MDDRDVPYADCDRCGERYHGADIAAYLTEEEIPGGSRTVCRGKCQARCGSAFHHGKHEGRCSFCGGWASAPNLRRKSD